MRAAIHSAKKSITFETYIYWSGTVGKKVATALAERAKSGVHVHLLLDWVGSSKVDQSLLDLMRTAGVEIEKYHPPKWYTLSKLNNRTHRKLLVVDGKIGFTGGVGIADEWDGNAQDPDHWRDTHFRIEGPAVAQMQAAFVDNWVEVTGVVLDGPDYLPAESSVGKDLAQVFKSSREGGSESMQLMYLLSTVSATRNIDLAMAYFVPDELSEMALVDAVKRGVKLRMNPAGPLHRHRSPAAGVACRMGTPAAGRRRDLRIPADHVSLQGNGRRQIVVECGFDQLRHPLFSLERRSQPQCLQRRIRRAPDCHFQRGFETIAAGDLRGMAEPVVDGEALGARGGHAQFPALSCGAPFEIGAPRGDQCPRNALESSHKQAASLRATPAHSKPGACGFRLPAWLTIKPYARLISSALRCGFETAARNSCTSDTKLVGVSTCPKSCLFIAILSLLRTW
jgi:PLD-like domain